MRTGKRALAGVAAGALGLALVPIIGVTSAQAADYTGTTSPVRQTSIDGTSPNSVPYAKVSWSGNAADDTFMVTLNTGVAGNPVIAVADTQGTSSYSASYGVSDIVSLTGTSDDTQLGILGSDDSYILIAAKSSGTYGGTIQTYNAGATSKTVSFSFTTVGAASAITLAVNEPSMAKDDTVSDFATVSVVTSDGTPTQLTSVDSVALATTADDSGAYTTPASMSYTDLAWSTADFTLYSGAVAGDYEVSATPAGSLLPTAVTGDFTVVDNVLLRSISMTDSATALNYSSATPAGSGSGIVAPGKLSVPFNLTAGDTEAGLPVILTITVSGATAYTESVNVGSDGTMTVTVPTTYAQAVQGNTIVVSDGSTSYTATYTAGAVYYAGVERTPSAGTIALATGTSKDIVFQVDDSYGVGQANYVVTATSDAASGSKTAAGITDSSGSATVTLADLSTTTDTSINWTFVVKPASSSSAIGGSNSDLNLTLVYTEGGEVTIKDWAADADDTIVPFNGVIGKNGNGGGATGSELVAVTATISVPNAEVTASGSGVWFCGDDTYTLGTDEFAAGCSEGSADLVANGSGVVTAYATSTATGEHTITLTTTSGNNVSGSTTWSNKAAAARDIAMTASPAKTSVGGSSNITVSVTDVFGNPVVITSSESVTLTTDLGTLAGGTNIYTINATTTSGTATVVAMSSTAGLATIAAAGKSGGGQYGDDADSPFKGASASVYQATTPVEFTTAPTDMTITISGERTTVKGKNGVKVDGLTTGISENEEVIPYIKFPGQTSYSAGTARPKVDADGEFAWQRKTGKKIYVYFVLESDTDVRSERIIIQAK